MDNANNDRCIYCNSIGPFNDEHVFSAGLGGDDNKYLLKNTVCQQCNSQVFKRFENEAFRRSPIAISRQFLQNHGRNRSKSTTAPGIITNETNILDSASGELLEARFRGKGSASILPQILFFPGSCSPTGEKPDHLLPLYQKMRMMMDSGEAIIIEKITNKRFKLSRYVIDGKRIELDEEFEDSRPPKIGIWLNCSFKKIESISQIARLYLENENLNLRISDRHSSEILSILLRAFKAVPYFEAKHDTLTTSTINNPLLSSSMSIEISNLDRALLKNSINLIAFMMGKEYINDPAFAAAKKFVLTGKGNIPHNFVAEHDFLEKLISDVPDECHVIMLNGMPNNNGLHLAVTFRLYGSGFHNYQVAEGLPATPLSLPILCLVHYNKNIIEVFNLRDFIKTHIRDFSKFHQ